MQFQADSFLPGPSSDGQHMHEFLCFYRHHMKVYPGMEQRKHPYAKLKTFQGFHATSENRLQTCTRPDKHAKFFVQAKTGFTASQKDICLAVANSV